MRWRQTLNVLDFLDELVNFVLTAAKNFFIPFLESISN